MAVGLKINFRKSCLMGVGIGQETLGCWAKILNWNVDTIPFTYLGLPVGARSNDKKVWKNVVDRVAKRLDRWENGFLSFGGRIVLLRSVLTSLPLYHLSFFKAPSFALNHLKKLFCHFLWGTLWAGLEKLLG